MTGRDNRRAPPPAASARTNEYFVPKDGIDREVITADICRYLGNDALVRPGNYENRQTGQVQAGYFITAYRNLTTAMIADLKADSDRWEQERRASASGGRAANVGYRDSTTHQSRQYYGPTGEVQVASSSGYPPSSGPGVSQGVYDSGSQYQQQYAQPSVGYASNQGYPVQDNYYVAGGNYAPQPGTEVDQRRSAPPPQSNVNVPRNVYSATTPTYSQQPERGAYYSPQPPAPPAATPQYPAQTTDPYYGRATAYDPQDNYDNRGAYQEAGSYPQTTMAPPANIPAPANSSSRRRDQERDADRSGHRDHRSSGRR